MNELVTKSQQMSADWELVSRVKAAAQDDPIREQFFQRWTGMIHSIVHKCSWAVGLCGDEFDDLVSRGFIGLIKAIDKFEKGAGLFSTFAYIKIKGEIWPKLHKVDKGIVSLDAVSETGETLIDQLPDTSTFEEAEINIQHYRVRCLVKALSPRFRFVIVQRFYRGLSLDEIGAKMGGISKEAVRQTQEQALALLKERIIFEGIIDVNKLAGKPPEEVFVALLPLFGGLAKSA